MSFSRLLLIAASSKKYIAGQGASQDDTNDILKQLKKANFISIYRADKDKNNIGPFLRGDEERAKDMAKQFKRRGKR